MQRNTRWIGLYTAILCAVGFGPARAEIAAVLPAEGGTVGTLMTLMGSGFGDKRGKVQLGTEDCQILSWGDTIVTCEVATPQPAGDYTVTLSPQGSNQGNKNVLQPMTFSSFTLRAPQITPGDPMQLVKPGDLVTIAGAFFGDKKGEVYLRDTPGDTMAAKVRDWSMDSISFEIPEGLAGCLALEVANQVGLDIQPFWGTLTPLPLPGAPLAGSTSAISAANNNASGVYFNNALWVFYAEPDFVISTHDNIHVLCFTNGVLKAAPDIGGSTSAQVVPLVIAHQLWAFCTGEDGTLCYKRFQTIANVWDEGRWNRIGSVTTDNHLEIAPVYNAILDRIEVYYWYNNTIRWAFSTDRGANWTTGLPISGLTQGVVNAPSAVFYQQTATNGVTLLATGVGQPDGTHPAVFWVRDGAVVKYHLFGPGLSGRPFVADLGEDYFAMTWITNSGAYPLIQKVNKNTGAWLPVYPPLSKATVRSPNLAVNYEQQTDNNSTKTNSLGVRWDANLYLFRADKDPGSTRTETWYDPVMSSIEALGYWQEITNSPQTTNLGYDETNFFQLWSVIGVIDAPPFVINGQDITNNNTCVKFDSSAENTAKTEMGFTIGPYIETGEKSPLKLELSETVGETIGNEHKTTVSFEYALDASLEGNVRVYYLAPELEVHQVQWHNPADLTETNNFIYPTFFTGNTSARSKAFDPTQFPREGLAGMQTTYFDLDNFPVHQKANDTERLETYVTPGDAYWFGNVLDWDSRGGPSTVSWWSSDTSITNKSATMQFKIGANIKGLIGFGIEGSFEVQTETTTTVTTGCSLTLDNPKPTNPPLTSDPIHHFAVNARWLAPSASGYWVPRNRQGYGDQPWFITYGLVPDSYY